MQYRKEIDGLRAIAVLPVIVFHAMPGWAPGGFVGVDVFFVISGFLITSIIAAELDAGRFSLLGFYERRARRILPALFAVIAACLPFAWLWMLPYQLKEFGQSLVAVAGFASNFLFWQQSGYFDSSAELKPLLHTWSLAVEEQYYLLFPLLLMLAWRMGRRGVFSMFVLASLASLAFAEFQAGVDRAAAFYLLPARAWELLLGAMLALRVPATNAAATPLRSAAGVAGLLLIAAGVFAFDRQTPFPGFFALAPTVGAALLIAFATPGTPAGRLLSLPLLVRIGLVSYSAYLWHFPVLAFWKLRTGLLELPVIVFVASVAATFLLAALSYRFVETPFRQRARIGRGGVFAFALAGIAGLAVLGYAAHTRNGFLEAKLASVPAAKRGLLVRVDEELALRTRIAVALEPELLQPDFAPGAARRIAIVGDSLSADLALALAQHRELFPGADFRLLNMKTECLGAAPGDGDACALRMREVLSSPLLRDADLVVLTGLWTPALDALDADALLARLTSVNPRLRVLGSGAFLDIPSLSYHVARDERAWTQDELDALVAASRREKFETGNASMRDASARRGIDYRDRHALYCDPSPARCRILMLDGRSLIWDNAHLTELGFRVTAERVKALGWLDPPPSADTTR